MPITTLHIHRLELALHLGWGEKERARKRSVLLDVRIRFSKPPAACLSDKLEDTVCYAKLCDGIRLEISKKEYRLIEHVSAEIYAYIKKQITPYAELSLRITKYPAIGGLKEGVSFDYGDAAW